MNNLKIVSTIRYIPLVGVANGGERERMKRTIEKSYLLDYIDRTEHTKRPITVKDFSTLYDTCIKFGCDIPTVTEGIKSYAHYDTLNIAFV
jgi:hypothetical protein